MEKSGELGQEINAKGGEVNKTELELQLERGANWFFWIAGLSIVNSLIFLGCGEGGFIFGLGITQVLDVIVMDACKDADMKAKACVFAVDIMVVCFVIMFGVIAKSRRRWGFIVGMILYSLDGLLFVLVQDILSVGFHAFALYGIYGGLKACRQLKTNENEDVASEESMTMFNAFSTEATEEDKMDKDIVWPAVITILSVVYLIFYVLISINNISKPLKIGGCSLFLGGIVGMAFRRKHAVTLVIIGSVIIIGYTFYSFFRGLDDALRDAPAGAIIVLCFFLALVLFWPVFLLFWFLRRKVREYIEREWL
jgi:hypothetical protein